MAHMPNIQMVMPLVGLVASIQLNHVQVPHLIFVPSFNVPLNVNNPMHGGHGLFAYHMIQNNPFTM